jgi:hypothetical protein
VNEIVALGCNDAVAALEELHQPKRFIRGSKGNQMDLDIQLRTIDDQRMFHVKALLDCGCTGNCIDSGFVKAKGIKTYKVPRAIPVYNADGTLNSDGPIKEFVTLHMTHGNHQERISLAVTNLGKGDVFIGHEWLKYHNPSIDWRKGELYC